MRPRTDITIFFFFFFLGGGGLENINFGHVAPVHA
jgi:hypothetical protein